MAPAKKSWSWEGGLGSPTNPSQTGGRYCLVRVPGTVVGPSGEWVAGSGLWLLLVRWVVPGVARRTSLAGVANKRLWRDGWARLRWWAGGARLDWRALAARLELELEQALWLLVEVEALVAPYGTRVAAGGSGGRWTPVLLPRSH